ncbi:FMRFamide receptor isoform X2 [Apis laboriosa]|uniref:FMRFamide receptor isoform X2 n=1 Tax=Apis laboriosa TaxID=183418 RepID=UPI001CC6833F|nr:FMRFamide receptor isoform X2 [Apis laboriosa]
MEINLEVLNYTNYYNASQLSKNLSIEENTREPLECKQEINSSGLFDFIIYGILVNLIGIFGIFGNAISMIILSRPQMKSSINYLLIGLARCDTMLIIISILIYGLIAIYTYTGLLFDYRFIVYPKIVRFLYPLSCMAHIATVYLTLTVTLERYIAVCHPLQARSFCTYGRARLAVAIILIFSFFYNLPKFWEVEYYTETHWKYNVTVYCVYPADLRSNNLYVTLYVHWMYFFICYLFPFLALVIFNVAIYRRVRKANRDLQQLSRHQRREIGLATMLLCVVIVFLICNILPLASNIHETFLNDPPLWLLFCSSKLFGPGRDSPEFHYDESIVTNMTNIERNSIRHCHLNRSSTINRNNNISNGSTRQSVKMSGRPASPGPCIYYPARSPSQMSRISNAQNGWNKKDVDSTL